jgi:hypothetical protein
MSGLVFLTAVKQCGANKDRGVICPGSDLDSVLRCQLSGLSKSLTLSFLIFKRDNVSVSLTKYYKGITEYY